jgi:integrase/recombinase XerD
VASVGKVDRPERWAVLDAHGVPMADVTALLRHLTAIERSPNTVKAYASDLALFFTFTDAHQVMWTAVNNEWLGKFIAWMRTPSERLVRPSNPNGIRNERTVNRALSAVGTFAQYMHDATGDPVYAQLLQTAKRRSNRFVEHAPTVLRVGPRLRTPERELKYLRPAEVKQIVDACLTLRDKFLISLLDQTGMRVGQALQLRHSDIRVPVSSIRVARHVDQAQLSHARNKSDNAAIVPVPGWLIRLYAGYMSAEYQMIDSDFVFVNLWSGPIGKPMSYGAVDKLVGRIRQRSGVLDWSVHTFRHTYVTRLLSLGVTPETVSYLVTHASVLTTLDVYNHISVDALRSQLEKSGAWSSG